RVKRFDSNAVPEAGPPQPFGALRCSKGVGRRIDHGGLGSRIRDPASENTPEFTFRTTPAAARGAARIRPHSAGNRGGNPPDGPQKTGPRRRSLPGAGVRSGARTGVRTHTVHGE